MPADEQIIKYNIDKIGYHIGSHGNFGIACAPLRRVNQHGQHIKHHAAHDDTKIQNRVFMRIRLRTCHMQNGVGKNHTGCADQYGEQQRNP